MVVPELFGELEDGVVRVRRPTTATCLTAVPLLSNSKEDIEKINDILEGSAGQMTATSAQNLLHIGADFPTFHQR